MPTIQTTAKEVTTEQAAEFRDALCWYNQYQATFDDGNGNQIPNPETKAQFAQRMFDEKAKEYGRNLIIAFRKSLQPPVNTNTGLE